MAAVDLGDSEEKLNQEEACGRLDYGESWNIG